MAVWSVPGVSYNKIEFNEDEKVKKYENNPQEIKTNKQSKLKGLYGNKLTLKMILTFLWFKIMTLAFESHPIIIKKETDYCI